MVHDVQCIKHPLHPAVRAPERNCQPYERRDAKSLCGLRRQSFYLLANDLKTPFRKNPCQSVQMLRDCAGIGVQTVECDQSGDSREQSQQHIESDAGSKNKDSIFRYALIDTKRDVLPSFGRNIAWNGCLPASVSLGRWRRFDRAALRRCFDPCLHACLEWATRTRVSSAATAMAQRGVCRPLPRVDATAISCTLQINAFVNSPVPASAP